MKRDIFLSTVAAALIATAAAITLPQGGFAAGEPMVGGAPMYASKNIIENAVNSKDHTHVAQRHGGGPSEAGEQGKAV